MFRTANSDWLRGVGVVEVPACAGHLLQHIDESGVVVVVRAARESARDADASTAIGACQLAQSQDVTEMHLLSPVSPMVGSIALTDALAAENEVVVAVASTATEKEKRLARRFQQVDGTLLQRALTDIGDAEFATLASTLDYLDDFIVAHAHAPLGTAADGSSLACYISRLGCAYVVDAGHVVHELRVPLAAALLAARAKRRATDAVGVHVPTLAPSFADERADTHCTAVAWSRALLVNDKPNVWLAVGTRSGRVSLLRFALADNRFRLPQPAVVIDLQRGAAADASAVTALLATADSKHLVVGLADGSVHAIDLASAASTPLLERSAALNTAAVALYEHARFGLFVARATDLFALPSIESCRRRRADAGAGAVPSPPPPPLRWRAHDTALTGLSGGVAHGQAALVTSAFDGAVHFWILSAAQQQQQQQQQTLRQAPSPIVLRRSGGGAVIGCALADNTVLVYKMSGADVRASFAVLRETGLVEALLAPWSSERGAAPPPPPATIDWSAPPRWGNVAPLLNGAFYDDAHRSARQVDIAGGADVRGTLHAFLAVANATRTADIGDLYRAAHDAAVRRHARDVLDRCGARLSAPARALFAFAERVELRCALCEALHMQRVPDTLDRLVCAGAGQHQWQLDVRTMALLGADLREEHAVCPACRLPTIVAPLSRDAATISDALPHLFVGHRGARATPLCVGCRLPVLPSRRMASRTGVAATFDVND
jgi:hypothetical protein